MRKQDRGKEKKERSFTTIVHGQGVSLEMHEFVNKVDRFLVSIQYVPRRHVVLDFPDLDVIRPLRKRSKPHRPICQFALSLFLPSGDGSSVSPSAFDCAQLLEEPPYRLGQSFSVQSDGRCAYPPVLHSAQAVSLGGVDGELVEALERVLDDRWKLEGVAHLIPDASMSAQFSGYALSQNSGAAATSSEDLFSAVSTFFTEKSQYGVLRASGQVHPVCDIVRKFRSDLKRLGKFGMLERRLHQLGRCDAHPLSTQVVVACPSLQGRGYDTDGLEYVRLSGSVAADEQVDSPRFETGPANRFESLDGESRNHRSLSPFDWSRCARLA